MSTFIIIELAYHVLNLVVDHSKFMKSLRVMISFAKFMAELCKYYDIRFKNRSE